MTSWRTPRRRSTTGASRDNEPGTGPHMDTEGASRRTYWLCQFAGWGLYTIYVLTFAILSDGFRLESDLCIIALLLGLCPLVTHGLRLWIRRRGWLLFPYQRLLPRLA